MLFTPRIVSSAAAIAITCAVSVAAYYFRNRYAEYNEVMVFCKLQYNVYNYFDKLMSYIEASKKCVNVCMPGIHNPAIQDRLVKLLKEKNVKVRIVIDESGCNDSNAFLLQELLEAGAEIKYKLDKVSFKTSHKFCIIDDKLLMTGTLNWGDDRSSDHWNYVYITSKKELVLPVNKEFYKIWEVSKHFSLNSSKSDDLYDKLCDCDLDKLLCLDALFTY